MRLSSPKVRAVALLASLAVVAGAAPGCAGRRKAKQETELLTAEALYRKGLTSLEERKLREARAYLERIQFTAGNRPELEPLVRLALADATFYAGDQLSLIEARSKYLDFVTLYGDHPQAPYAQFQAGVASLKQVNHPSRDQSQTQVAISDLKEVGRRWPDSSFAAASEQMIGLAHDHLAEHEHLVGRFYFKRRDYQAATERLRNLLTSYPRYSHRDEVYLLLGQSLVRANSADEGRVYLDKLVTDFPASEAAKEARKLLAELSGGKPEPERREGRAAAEPRPSAG
jgi:outer membrane protein assembly factor BamD